MWHVLEHVTKLNNTISEMKKLLSNKGKVIIAVPNLESFDATIIKNIGLYDLPIHMYHFSRTSITKLFENMD